ncbi:MAG: ubiquinol-cytochrome c reductase iron-sulfur subunit [Pseudomonadota bacterium]
MAESDEVDEERRDFLLTATGTVGVVGVAAACWPFISSMNPTLDVQAQAATDVDLSGMAAGATRTVAWRGKPVFVVHRTPEQIAAMAQSEGGRDPAPDQTRVRDARWLVVVGICTHLGCVPNKTESGWLCPCHGSVYDNSGRILHGPAPRNLEVPPYHFAAPDKIVIG